ncbi:MAG: oligosaccharide flippase family protein [Clostridiales bacterium]|nr:oligosaccharide flippase family protein [Clostridiales bacterium]
MTSAIGFKRRSRTRNSARNTLFAAIAYVTKVLLQFIVRAIFIRYFVREYLGINGLFSNVLKILSLAELGVGNAIVYSMYKPVAENDTEKIKSLVRLYRNLYLIIASIIIAVGLALIPALPYIINDAKNVDINITVVYLLSLAHTVIGYFFAYRRALIFAHQRNDIESKVSFFAQIVLSIAEIIIILVWKNFYAYTAASVICYGLDAFIVFLISYKMFPEIRGKPQKLDKEETKKIAKNTGAMVFHKMGAAAVFSTDSIFISAYIGVATLGLYDNYTLVTSTLTSIANLIMTALKSSVGNMIATKKPDEVYKVFNALNLAMMWFVSFMTVGIVVCFQDFIRLYSGNPDYLLGYSTVLLLCTSFYFTRSRSMANNFKDCAGLFWNDRFKPIFETGINLGLDFLLVYFWGINGIITATIISTIAAPLWVEPFVLYKNYFKKPIKEYFIRYLVFTVVAVAACGATWCLCNLIPVGSVWWFVLKFFICLVLPNAVFFLCYYNTPEVEYLLSVAKSLLRRKKDGATAENVDDAVQAAEAATLEVDGTTAEAKGETLDAIETADEKPPDGENDENGSPPDGENGEEQHEIKVGCEEGQDGETAPTDEGKKDEG